MIHQYINNLNLRFIVLASASPRRRTILENIGLIVHPIPSTFEENLVLEECSSAAEYAMQTAKRKALNVCNYLEEKKKADLIIGADTVVVLGKEVLGKPKSRKDAFDMLKRLSGTTHTVITGVALVHSDLSQGDGRSNCSTFYEETEVTFGNLSNKTIEAYVETGEPLDKAGAYAVQGAGATLVKSINGDYWNVVGFPLYKFALEIEKLCLRNIL